MPTVAFVKASLAPFVRTLIYRFKFAARIGRVIPAKRWRVARSPAALQRRFSPVTVLAVLRCASYVFLLSGLLSFFLSGACTAFAQTETATLSGIIQDPKGGVVPDVEVVATRIETGTVATTKTNGAGIYFFTGLVPGHYHLVIRKPGFKEIAIKDFQLFVQDKLEQNFSLAIGSVSEVVTVNGDDIHINATDASVGTVIDRQFVANIPLNGRSLQSLISLTPGVLAVPSTLRANTVGGSGEFSVNGQRTEANYFTVDGVSVNTGANPSSTLSTGMAGTVAGETALGTTQSMISLDALEEFRATTSTYSAEYGRTPGGQFSFVSRSGSNSWHGSAFDYFRNEALDANNWFSNAKGIPKTPERQNDFGGTLGGPLWLPGLYNGRDKTFFFFSYEGLRLRLPAGTTIDSYPDVNLRNNAPLALQPFLNAFPIPNGPEKLDSTGKPTGLAFYTAGYSNPSSLDAISIRVDHNLRTNMKIFGRYSSSPSSAAVRQAGRDLANFLINSVKVKTLTLGLTNAFSPHLSSDLRFNYTRNHFLINSVIDGFGGAKPFDVRQVPGFEAASSYGFAFFPSSTTSKDRLSVGPQQDAQQQWNLTDAFVANHGSHNLKFGIDYRRLSTLLQNRLITESGVFSRTQSVLSNTPLFIIVSSDAPVPAEPLYTNFSAYAQDDWKVTSRLSLSFGLRWELVPPPGNGNGPRPYTLNEITDLSTAQIAPQGTPLWQTDYRAFAPRLGAAYQLRQIANMATIIRGGFGVFYDMGTTLSSVGFYNVGFSSGLQRQRGSPFPLAQNLINIPPPSVAAPYNAQVDAVDPHLRLPYTLQWNAAVEQSLGRNQALTLTYVGSAGRRLLFSTTLEPTNVNKNFANGVNIIRNASTSDYDALQAQFQRRLSAGLQALLAYTWAHSIDDGSTAFYTLQRDRRDSDFDVRHNFQMALTYDIPGNYSSPILSAILKHWGLDTRISARSALPVDITGSFGQLPDGTAPIALRPDLAPGVPTSVPIYLTGPQYPGGRILNSSAFQPSAANTQGNVPRNFARDFGAVQADLALRREFPLYERLHLQFRAEAFNIFNHPNFSSIDNFLPDGAYNPATLIGFGGAQSTPNNSLGGLNALYQVGGPRSLQLSLRLQF